MSKNNLIDLAPSTIQAELANLSPEALLFIQQNTPKGRQKSDDALKLGAVVDILVSHLDSLEADYLDLCENPDGLVLATLLLACQLLLGTENIEGWEEDPQFQNIKKNLEGLSSNKHLLSLFPKMSVTKQFKGSRKKSVSDEGDNVPLDDKDDEDEAPVVTVNKRNTLKKAPSK
jgi:hypothetical protein